MDFIKQHGGKIAMGVGAGTTIAVGYMNSDQINLVDHWGSWLLTALGFATAVVGAVVGVIRSKKGNTN